MRFFSKTGFTSRWRLFLRKLVMIFGIILLVLIALISGLLFFFQRRMIYFPRAYDPIELRAEPRIQPIEYNTPAGRQMAFYLPPREGVAATPAGSGAPACLWVLFNGNGSRALDWLSLLNTTPDPGAGYLLIDYPSYGKCAGTPTEKSIAATTPAALKALAAHLGVAPAQLEENLNVMGYSLGAATALQFSVTVPVRRVILISPFTSLLAMARRSVGPLLCHLLRDRFDNAARLNELAAHKPRPRVTILHGSKDEVIPLAMGRQLAAAHPDWIEFLPIARGYHGTMLERAGRELYARMRP